MIGVITNAAMGMKLSPDPLTATKAKKPHSRRLIFTTMLLTASISCFALPGAAAGAGTPRAKPTIVLVHGAFADAGGWKRVIPLLRKEGFQVVAVENPLTSFSADVAQTRRAIRAQKGPVIAIGHSYGGAVITEAAAGSANVKALVYIAAFAPAVGEPIGKFLDQFPSDLGAALRKDEAGFVTIERPKFRTVFAGDVSLKESAQMATTQRPIASTSFSAKISRAAWTKLPSWYLVARQDRALNPDLQRFYGRRIGATTVEIDSSHVPFVSHPQEVAKFIKEAAQHRRD